MMLVEDALGDAKLALSSTSASNGTEGTALVDQDGHDISYYIEAKIGTLENGANATTFNLIVDTGSFYTWVYSNSCTTAECAKHTSFDPSTSSTSELTGSNFSIAYTSGSVSGEIAVDVLAFAGFQSPQHFGLANNIDSSFADFPIDGIMGIPFGDKDPENFPGLVNTLKKQGLIEDRVFGINLGRGEDKSDEGSFTLGGLDESKYTGDIHYEPVVADSLFWELAINTTKVNGEAVDFGGSSRTAIIDTGTTLLIMSPSDALKVHGFISGSQTDGSNFVIPCNTSLSLSFSFASGVEWSVDPKDYVGGSYNKEAGLCLSNIQGIQFDNDRMILGDVFLKNVYSVYNMDKQVVGFANKSVGATEVTPDATYVLVNNDTSASSVSSSPSTSSSPSSSSTSASSSASASSSSSSSTQSNGCLGKNGSRTVSLLFVATVVSSFALFV